MSHTITAIATPPGTGGIAVLRISGDAAQQVINRIFVPRTPLQPRVMTLGTIIDSAGEPIDQALGVLMPGPNSYTGEDVAELQFHGGEAVAQAVLALALENGAALAEPGEFTKRAFLNGKLALSQAEAVADMIAARGSLGVRLAARALSGRQQEKIHALQERLTSLLARVEAMADFPEDDTETAHTFLVQEAAALKDEVTALAQRADTRVINGFSVVLAGRVNAGKSSLLNALLEAERAIVSDLPGTTRDIVDAELRIDGAALRLMDTAGLRQSDNPIERVGIDKAQEAIRQSDLVLLLIDGSEPFDEDEVNLTLADKDVLPVINKADKPLCVDIAQITSLFGEPVVLSALTGQGIDSLRAELGKRVKAGAPEDIVFFRERQIRALRDCVDALTEAHTALTTMPIECAAAELHRAGRALGQITGETVDENVIEEIFSTFCIGK